MIQSSPGCKYVAAANGDEERREGRRMCDWMIRQGGKRGRSKEEGKEDTRKKKEVKTDRLTTRQH